MLKSLIACTALLATVPVTAQDRLSLICKGAFRGQFKDLEVAGAVVTPEGRIRYGLFSGTKFMIDRRTGIMTGDNGFTGICAA
jgi:hypothetical protein